MLMAFTLLNRQKAGSVNIEMWNVNACWALVKFCVLFSGH